MIKIFNTLKLQIILTVLTLNIGLFAQITTSGRITSTGGIGFTTTTFVPAGPVHLPTAYGWSPLSASSTCGSGPCADTTMIGSVVDPGTVAQYTDSTHTSTTNVNFSTGSLGLQAWFNAWSTFATDDVNQQFWEFAGGHSDTPNNELAVFKLQGTSPNWSKFSTAGGISQNMTIPAGCAPGPPGDNFNYEAFAPFTVQDSTSHVGYSSATWPAPRHSYSGLFYYPPTNQVFQLGGALSCDGNPSAEVWRYDIASKTWSMLTPYGRGGGETHGSYDWVHQLYIYQTLQGAGPVGNYNPSTNTNTVKVSSPNWTIGGDVNGAEFAEETYDPSDNYVVATAVTNPTGTCSGAGIYCEYFASPLNTPSPVRGVRAWDWTLSSPTTLVWDDSSCDQIWAYTSTTWDSNLGLLVGYSGSGSTIFFQNPTAFDVTTQYGVVPSHKCLDATIGSTYGIDYPTDPFFNAGDNNIFVGLFKRFSYFKSLDKIIMANNASNEIWALNLKPLLASQQLIDKSGSNQTSQPYTLAQAFKQGEIAHYAQPLIAGQSITTWQNDQVQKWPDGSLKWALISLVVPSITANSAVTVTFQSNTNICSSCTGSTPTGYLSASGMLAGGYNFDAQIQLTGTASPTISARTILSAASGGSGCGVITNFSLLCRYWLQGPVVTAAILEDRAGKTYDTNTDGTANNPLHPIFEAWFYPQTNAVDVGITLENTWASGTSSNSANNQTFSMVLTTGNTSPTTQLTQASFTQFAFTRWRRGYCITAGTCPENLVNHNYNWRYLMTTKYYPPFDSDVMPLAADLTAETTKWTNNSTGVNAVKVSIPGLDFSLSTTWNSGTAYVVGNYVNDGFGNMYVCIQNNTNHALSQTAFWTSVIPGSGVYPQAIDAGGGDLGPGSFIGLMPTWDAKLLMTGDSRMRTISLNSADLVGVFPQWFREADTSAGTVGWFDAPTNSVGTEGRVISINARPQVRLQPGSLTFPSGCTSPAGSGDEIVTGGNTITSGSWNPTEDTSHFPDTSWVPFSLTGRYYYLEQLQMQAAWALGQLSSCTRLGNGGSWRGGRLGNPATSLVRDQAWFMRTIDYAAFSSPDGSPEKAYFLSKLQNTIAFFEGAHGITQDVVSNSDTTSSYGYGTEYQFSQNASSPTGCCMESTPSPLGVWEVDGAALSYAINEAPPNSGAVIVAGLNAANSMFQESYHICSLGMIQMHGMVDTSKLRAFEGKNYIHTLLDPAVSPYLMQQYVSPAQNGDLSWVATWAAYSADFITPVPSGWNYTPPSSSIDYGLLSLGATAFLTDLTVDGYSGTQAYWWYRYNNPDQANALEKDPRWTMRPAF